MKRWVLILLLSLGLAAASTPVALAADSVPLTSCGAAGATNKLDPVANPYDLEKSGRRISTETISTWNAVSNGDSGISANWNQWAVNSQSLVSYFTYLSADGGASWTCYRSFGSTFIVGNLVVNGLYKFALLANSGDDWSKPVFIDIQLGKKMPEQICPPSNYLLGPAFGKWPGGYSKLHNWYSLTIHRDQNKVDVRNYGIADLPYYLRYLVEYSIDNWKTKVVHLPFVNSQKFEYIDQAFYIKVLSKTKPVKVRAIPDASHFFVPDDTDPQEYSTHPIPGYVPKPPTKGAGFTTIGCKPFLATLYPKELKYNPCLSDNSQCPAKIVPGENTTTSGKPVTIYCVKGSTTKKFSGADPKCPDGYKKK